MKKPAVLLLIALCSADAYSQARSTGSFNVGPIVTFRSTWLLNKNVTDAPETEQAYVPSWGPGFGINLGSYFNDNFGIELDIFFSQHNQKYKGGDTYNAQFRSNTKLSMLDLPMVILLKANTGSYFEIGAMYSLVNKAAYERTVDSSTPDSTNFTVSKDVKADYKKNNFAAVVGFGMEGNLSDELLICFGFRFTYGLSDIEGVDGRGIPYKSGVFTDPYATHTATGSMHIGLKYMLQY